MSRPTIETIANELNIQASRHPIGALQDIRKEIRGYGIGNDLFKLQSKTTRDGWACHWGGRTELQFNIGFDTSQLRHGVAFDFSPSRSYGPDELLEILKPKVILFNQFARRHPELFSDMRMWAGDGVHEDLICDAPAGPIPARCVASNVFVFLGKLQPLRRINYELILSDFDRLLPIYRYVESHGEKAPTSVRLEASFSFRAGCRPKKRSAIIQESREQIERELRHNELQEKLHRCLVRQFGKDNVGTENHGVNGTSIDLVVRLKGGYLFYEIKTAPSARACIREALGQLLEYAFWPGAQEAVRLIVAGEPPLDEPAQDYLRCLKKRFSLPIEYKQIRP